MLTADKEPVSQHQVSKPEVSSRKRRILNFVVQDTDMCIDIENVEKVLLLVALQHVPSAPLFVAGLMNVAGKSVPVIDLAERLGHVRSAPCPRDAQIILCKHGTRSAGIIVSEIQTVEVIDDSDLQANVTFGAEGSLFAAAVNVGLKQSLLLNAATLMDLDLSADISTRQTVAGEISKSSRKPKA